MGTCVTTYTYTYWEVQLYLLTASFTLTLTWRYLLTAAFALTLTCAPSCIPHRSVPRIPQDVHSKRQVLVATSAEEREVEQILGSADPAAALTCQKKASGADTRIDGFRSDAHHVGSERSGI